MSSVIMMTSQGVVYGITDSICVNECQQTASPEDKLFTKGDLLIGITGHFAILQLIKYHINLYRDKRIDKQTILEYLVCTFIPAVKNKIQEENLQDAWEKSSALIGAEGRIFLITKNFAVIEQPEVAAIGIHHGFALGYVTTIKGCWPPQEILNKAMHALIRNSQGCIGPVVEKMI